MSRDRIREDRGIADADPLEPVHAQLGINNSTLALPPCTPSALAHLAKEKDEPIAQVDMGW